LKVALNTIKPNSFINWGSSGRDRMVVGFATTCAIDAFQHYYIVLSVNPAHV